MTAGLGPTNARRRLRTKLRQLREAVNYSLDDVRKHMEWSMSKLIRVENGAVSLSTNDLKILLDLYGARDEATVSHLVELSRLSRQRHWANKYRPHISHAHLDVIGYEDDARQIKQFSPVAVPTLLQTEAYARALVTAAPMRPATPDETTSLVKLRLARQARVLQATTPVSLTVVMDEAALLRPIGGPGIMRQQLDHLLAASGLANIRILIIPLSVVTHPGLIEPFCLIEFTSDDDPDLTYLEHAANGVSLVETFADVAAYQCAFERLLQFVMPDGDVPQYLCALRARLPQGIHAPP